MTVSVAMATYNGERYIRQQLESIQHNLDDDSEIVISDDGSQDLTLDYIHDMQSSDNRIRLVNGPQQGVIANFENAISQTHGDIIFLADQDDVWLPEKVHVIQSIFCRDPCITCVLHDVSITDKDLRVVNRSFFSLRGSKRGFHANLLKNSYMGSAMAFKREMLDKILPIPRDVPMHDQWIGLINDLYGKVYFCYTPLGLYRRHDGNVSSLKHGSLGHMIRNRYILISDLYKRR